MSTILVAGASGAIGAPLVGELRSRGHTVRRLVRRVPRSYEERAWDPARARLDPDAFDGVDAVVVLSGAGVGDRRWTAARKEVIVSSRVSTVGLLATALAERGDPHVRLIAASAVGWYGDRGEQEVAEPEPAGEGFLADVCRQWEAAADPARAAGLPVVHLRTGIVLAPGVGAVGKLMPLLKLGLAGPLGDGRQWWPWITLPDEVAAIAHLVGSEATGPVNLVAPGSARCGELIFALARAQRRPAFVRVPGLALRIALGEFAGELLASQRVTPAALLADGFDFQHPNLDGAARWVAAG